MERAKIGANYPKQADWKIYLGVLFIYLPILTTVPFVLIGILLVRIHLKFIGGMELRSYWDFVPEWISHRYRYNDQIVYTTGSAWYMPRLYRWFWIFNCKLYCPMSVALFRYVSYLVMIVENWWCPFNHGKKQAYAEGAIDRSFWHLEEHERTLLHPEDRDNPIWNEEADEQQRRND